MSIDEVAYNIRQTAIAHERYREMLDIAAEKIVREVRDNIRQGRNAGKYRVTDAGGTTANAPMLGPSVYTLKKRQRFVEGDVFGTGAKPLFDTGELHRSIAVIGKSQLKRRIGAKGAKNAKKLFAQLGTGYTGVVSSDLNREIPARNPVGFKESTAHEITGLFKNGFGVNDKATGKIIIRF